MLPKISRYFLIIVTVFSLAYALPAIYHTLFDTRVNMPFITYSSLTQDYYFMEPKDGKPAFVNREGKFFDQFTFMDMAPVENYTYHLSKGTLPDSVNGVRLDPRELQRQGIWQFFDPRMLNYPAYHIYPLFESEPDFGLKLPEDVFRIKDRIEFINAKSNKVEEKKSQIFNDVFTREGFSFPAKVIAGIPSVMKRRDDGWFITDSKGSLYHLKMIKGNVFFKKITKPDNIRIKMIQCNDFDSREFYAMLITDENKLYTLNTDYSFTKVPIPGYNPKQQSMILSGNIFNKNFSIFDDSEISVYTLDRNYKLVDQFKKEIPQKSQMTQGIIFSYLFPFQIKAESSNSSFVILQLEKSPGYHWFILTLLFLAFSMYLINKQKRRWSNNILDLVIVALTGIFGFLAIRIFSNKEY